MVVDSNFLLLKEYKHFQDPQKKKRSFVVELSSKEKTPESICFYIIKHASVRVHNITKWVFVFEKVLTGSG